MNVAPFVGLTFDAWIRALAAINDGSLSFFRSFRNNWCRNPGPGDPGQDLTVGTFVFSPGPKYGGY